MYADFDQKEKARTSIPKVANFLQLGLPLILILNEFRVGNE